MKQSKNIIALWANHPTLHDWVVNYLTEADVNSEVARQQAIAADKEHGHGQ